ncbi:hypothetical protein WR25_06283 isoform D [Diploscapter pachys]|uniref:Prolylcarboxypeptidase n=1 Tax=Diploscapter pachys TaxID=2018661 RepID=A0A2A2LRP1_9BILA|nr:hypothetical protein WR25_06283 isoform D [Diploscapter pachys]
MRILLLLLSILLEVDCLRVLRDPVTLSFSNQRNRDFKNQFSISDSPYQWSTEWLANVPVDHFAFANNDTFKLRYFINTKSYEEGGPIFFYTGNEGALEGFALNTGFMWDIAPEFKAAVVFAEHRYYGETWPYPKSLSYNDTRYLGYLSSEQALADFALLIDHLKQNRIPGAANSPVIVFGGSYGGMLSAWMRIKYPHIVHGAIAASAPVFWFFDSGVKEDVYDEIVTRAFVTEGCNFKAIEKAWVGLDNLAQTEEGRAYLNSLFKLEKTRQLQTPGDVNIIKNCVHDVFDTMAMVNYPYESNFMAPLPGWPVAAACKSLSVVAKSDKEAAEGLHAAVNLYYNYTGKAEILCTDPDAALGENNLWPYQACTEMVMPICSSGPPNDFFWNTCPFTAAGWLEECKQLYGKIGFDRSQLRPYWATRNYGRNRYPTGSNIVFTNGKLDPWSGGGFSFNKSMRGPLYSMILERGAHHYDLRGAHPKDTDEVKTCADIPRFKGNLR